MRRALLFLLLAAQVPLFSQLRRGRSKPAADQSAPVERSKGKLTKIDEKTLVVDAPDGRTLEFTRSEKTKFFRDTQEIQPAEFKPGSQVTVEATQDENGVLHALNVYLEKAIPHEAEAGPPPEAAGRAPGNTPLSEAGDNDPGPPVLKRGVPVERPSPQTADLPEAPAEPAPPVEAAGPSEDPLIAKARETTVGFTDKLPNYVCKEFMTRYASSTEPADWKPLDLVSTDLVYEQGREKYGNISVNGKPFRKGMQDLGGAWSTGEFGTMLLDLFAPGTAAQFELRREGSIAGARARVYDFEVERTHSHWRVSAPSQSMFAGYRGSVWIEPQTGRVLRLEIQARALPKEFPLDTVESAVDYDHVMIGGRKFLLPVHAETLACERGTRNCSRNTIDFRTYHKYEASSDITFASDK
jgi:hypothetical protein